MKVAIASGKGGTGKTTLATNLSAYLAESFKVVLVDLDVEEPNSRLFIKGDLIHQEIKHKLVPEWNRDSCKQQGICKKVCNFNAIVRLGPELIIFPELCHSCYACVELCPSGSLKMIPSRIGELSEFKAGNLSFVESRLDIGQEQAVPLIAQTKKYIDEHFNSNHIKIYDSPPGTTCPVIETIKDVDFVLLVTEPTPFGLHDLKIAVEVVKKLNKEMAVIINRWGIGDNNVEEFCSNNNIRVIAKVPNNIEIAQLYSSGKLIYKNVREFHEQIMKIKNFLLEWNK